MATLTFGEKLLKFFIIYFVGPLIYIWVKLHEIFIEERVNNCTKMVNLPVVEAEKIHAKKLLIVQNQVKEWNKCGRKGFMCTGRLTWQSVSVHQLNKEKFTQIQLDLDDIIHIDAENKILTVEPGMTMGRLTSILIPMGWTIPVVPELEPLTLGGCICGAGLETSSHKYGLLADACLSYELVLASGEVITCNEKENSDLFHSIPMSHATIGFLTAVQIPLIPAKKYVKIEYFSSNSIDNTLALLRAGESKAEFLEGFAYDLNRAVVMYGNMVDEAEAEPSKVNYINKWYKRPYYKQVENNFLNSSGHSGVAQVEYIPLRDYYHRHSRGCFWENLPMLPYINNPIFLYLLGWILPLNHHKLKRMSNLRLWELFWVRNHVLQDFVVPVHKFKSTLKFAHDLVQVYPIWLCPAVFLNKPGRGKPVGAPNEMFIDIGIYGETPKVKEYSAEVTTSQMEQFVIANNGYQGTYADIYMTREEFRKMYAAMADTYDQVRLKYGAVDAFPEVYDKISRHARKNREKSD